jgi:hypothetical protein
MVANRGRNSPTRLFHIPTRCCATNPAQLKGASQAELTNPNAEGNEMTDAKNSMANTGENRGSFTSVLHALRGFATLRRKTPSGAQQRNVKQTAIRDISGSTLKPTKTHGFLSKISKMER